MDVNKPKPYYIARVDFPQMGVRYHRGDILTDLSPERAQALIKLGRIEAVYHWSDLVEESQEETQIQKDVIPDQTIYPEHIQETEDVQPEEHMDIYDFLNEDDAQS